MLYLLLCILTNVVIFLCFRQFKKLGLNTFQAIVFNYITCVLTGFIFLGDRQIIANLKFTDHWVIIGLILGMVFISTFYLMALTTQRFTMTVSSIASKMSLIIPVLISLLILNVQSKDYSIFNYIGMTLAIPAIFFSSYKKKGVEGTNFSGLSILLPLSVFVLGGLIDSTINYTSFHYLNEATEPLFPTIIFSSATIVGVVLLIVRKKKIQLKNIIGGVILGVVNYFSIYFLIRSLTYFNNDGAVVYPLLNVGVILVSALFSIFIFKEHLSKLNRNGLLLAILCIILISLEELITFFR